MSIQGSNVGRELQGGLGCPPLNPKAAEAQLLTQATNTAMVAARSILMSGGSEEVALKTAKAAAQSVLAASGNDNESTSGFSGTSFLRRRKAKRQAEVLASMALMSVASSARSTKSGEGNELISKLCGKSFTAGSMKDELSVLTGSTKTHRLTPTHNQSSHTSVVGSHKSASASYKSASASINGMVMQEDSAPTNASRIPPSKELKHEGSEKKGKFLDKILRRKKNSQKKALSQECPDISIQVSSLYSASASIEDDSTCGENNDKKREQQSSNVWSHLDPFLTSFTNTFNALSCGPLATAFPEEDDSDETSEKLKNDEKSLASLDDESLEDRQDQESVRDDESFDPSELKEVYSSSTTGSSIGSSQILQDLHSDSMSEGEIQIRSSIRATMEKITSKSRHGGDKDFQKDWLSYELRQDDGPVVLSEVSKAITPSKHKRSIFKRIVGKGTQKQKS